MLAACALAAVAHQAKHQALGGQEGGHSRSLLDDASAPEAAGLEEDEEEEEEEAEELRVFRKHGILLTIAFCILMPLAFLANRLKNAHFLRDQPSVTKSCFYLHVLLNVSAVALAAAGFALPFAKLDEPYNEIPYSHGSFGVAIMVLLFLQAVYPWLRPAPTPLTTLRRVWELTHTTLGRAVFVMALVNIALGVLLIKEEFNGSVRMFACLAAVPVCAVALLASIVDRLSTQSAAANSPYAAASPKGLPEGKEQQQQTSIEVR